MTLLAEGQIRDQFDKQGFVVLRDYIDQQLITEMQDELEHIVDEEADKLLAAGKIKSRFENEPFETRMFKLYESDVKSAPTRFRENLHRPAFYKLFFHPDLLDTVELLLGPEIRVYPNYTVRPKFPDWAGHQVLWHQDGGYTGTQGAVSELRMVNVWTPLVPVNPENGCMQFIPGTHKLGILPHDSKEYYLQLHDEHLKPRLHQAIDLAINPGDVIFFHNLLFHQGLPNRTKKIRWSVDWRYQDATQDTQRAKSGHLARSQMHPEDVVRDAEHWSKLSYT